MRLKRCTEQVSERTNEQTNKQSLCPTPSSDECGWHPITIVVVVLGEKKLGVLISSQQSSSQSLIQSPTTECASYRTIYHCFLVVVTDAIDEDALSCACWLSFPLAKSRRGGVLIFVERPKPRSWHSVRGKKGDCSCDDDLRLVRTHHRYYH